SGGGRTGPLVASAGSVSRSVKPRSGDLSGGRSGRIDVHVRRLPVASGLTVGTERAQGEMPAVDAGVLIGVIPRIARHARQVAVRSPARGHRREGRRPYEGVEAPAGRRIHARLPPGAPQGLWRDLEIRGPPDPPRLP